MKQLGILIVAMAFVFVGCDNGTTDSGSGNQPVPVTLNSVTADGNSDGTSNTTELTITFSAAVTGITADSFTLSGKATSPSKGALSGSGPTYTLPISNFIANDEITIRVGNVPDYDITGDPKTANIYFYTNPSLEATWYNSQATANNPPSGGASSIYFGGTQFNATLSHQGPKSGRYSITPTTITITGTGSSAGETFTANYLINGTELTVSNTSGNWDNGFFEAQFNKVYKKAE